MKGDYRVTLHLMVLGDLAAVFLDAVAAEDHARAECDTAEPESVEWLRLKDASAFHAERRYKIGCLIAQTLGLPSTSTRGELLDAIKERMGMMKTADYLEAVAAETAALRAYNEADKHSEELEEAYITARKRRIDIGDQMERRIKQREAQPPASLAERTLTRAELERPFDAAAIRRQNEQRRAIYRDDDEELGE